MTTRTLPAFAMFAVILAAGASLASQRTPNDPSKGDGRALNEFADAVDEYVQLHRALFERGGSDVLPPTPEEIERRSQRLAQDLRYTRAGARVGEFFTPAVARFFRGRFATDVLARTDEAQVVTTESDPLANGNRLELHGRFPWEVSTPVESAVRRQLPPLPAELDYQLVGRALVLLDVRANVIVDVLFEAVPARPARHATEPQTPATPCEVHPDLPMCWS